MSLINPFFFFRLRLVDGMKKYSKELNGRLLDFGCGCKPYQELFKHVFEYVGVDVENVSIQQTAYYRPI